MYSTSARSLRFGRIALGPEGTAFRKSDLGTVAVLHKLTVGPRPANKTDIGLNVKMARLGRPVGDMVKSQDR